MFRQVRKKKNEIGPEAIRELLISERRAVLSVNGDDGYPYGVPINFYYAEEEGKIYFHGSRAGHKIDAIGRSDKVCLTVTGGETVKVEPWAPFVRSAVVFGRCRPVDDPERAEKALIRFAEKYYPDHASAAEEAAASGAAVLMLELTVEHVSGKQIQEK